VRKSGEERGISIGGGPEEEGKLTKEKTEHHHNPVKVMYLQESRRKKGLGRGEKIRRRGEGFVIQASYDLPRGRRRFLLLLLQPIETGFGEDGGNGKGRGDS